MTFFAPPVSLQPLLARIETMTREAGLEAYIVGGSVRDALRGRAMRDLDIAVDRDAMPFARRLADALGGHFVALDDANVIARVVLHDAALSYIDVAQLQGSLDDDLRRRDFTVDALAVCIGDSAIIDICGGLDDLAARRVRMTAERAFDDDPLRLVRGARIAAELGFEIEPETAEAIRARAARVLESSAERRRDELIRIFALDAAAPAVRLLDDLRLLDALLPEVTAGRGVTQPKEHSYDVLEHGIRAVEAMDIMLATERPSADRAWMWDVLWRIFSWCEAPLRAYIAVGLSEGRSRGALLKLTALLHDIAKPRTRSVETDGRIRFLGHADEGAAMATQILRRHRFSARETAFVARLVEEHLRPVQLAPAGEVPTGRALYRFHRDLGGAVEAVLLLSLADAAAARGERMTSEGWSSQAAYMNSLLVRLQGEEGIVDAPRLLTGHDIMVEFGLSEGPRIGHLLEALREAQATADVRDRQGALAFVRAFIDAQTGEKDV